MTSLVLAAFAALRSEPSLPLPALNALPKLHETNVPLARIQAGG